MDHNKDIGKLIKEHLANTEVEPNDALWASIERTLDSKRRRRGGIIWWSTAILLMIGIFSGVYLLYDTESKITVKEDVDHPVLESELKSKKKNNSNSFNKIEKQEKNISSEANEHSKNPEKEGPTSISDSEKIKDKVVTKTTTKSSNGSSSIVGRISDSKSQNKTSNHSEVLKQEENYHKEEVEPSRFDNANESLVEGIPLKSGATEKSRIKKSSNIKDSVAEVAEFKRNPAKDGNPNKRKKKKKDITNQTWSISVQGGPNAFEYLTDSNPFKSSLSNGVLQSRYSYSYGAFLNIPLNDEFTFRFGFRNSNYKFYIEEAVSGVRDNGTLLILNDASIKRNGAGITTDFENSLNPPNQFRIEQEINYREIPFQFLYRIRDKSVKIDAILGLSAMLITKNSTTLSNPTSSIEIGSGAYAKKTAFSSSIGLGFRYKLSDRLLLDLEPTFQFQYGAFNKDFKNLRPVILNLNLGATIKL